MEAGVNEGIGDTKDDINNLKGDTKEDGKENESTGISLSEVRKHFGIDEVDIRTYSPLTLAYMGDSVFEIIIRTMVVARGNMPTEKQHDAITSLARATSQAKMLEAIDDDLTEQEADIVRRGRNAKPKNTAKSATRAEYLMSTAFEALLGYLYLDGQMDRLYELIRMGIERTAVKD